MRWNGLVLWSEIAYGILSVRYTLPNMLSFLRFGLNHDTKLTQSSFDTASPTFMRRVRERVSEFGGGGRGSLRNTYQGECERI